MDTTLDHKSHIVKAGAFEGPLEILLNLIESRKLFINEISLAEVTNAYLEKIKTLRDYSYIDVTGFLIIAATLVLIKSKSLLPNFTLTTEEEEKIVDLETRLKLYQVFKDVSREIKTVWGDLRIYLPLVRKDFEPVFAPHAGITPASLSLALTDVLREVPQPEVVKPEVNVKKIISIDEMMHNITERITNAFTMTFRNFVATHNTSTPQEAKVNTIVSFLAMLELVRNGIIDVIQENSFDDMIINKQETI